MSKKLTTTQQQVINDLKEKARSITNQANYKMPPGTKITMPSETVPNQSMTVAEMVSRYNSGLPMTGQKVPMYFEGDSPLPDISNMDLADAQAITEQIADKLVDLKARIEQAKQDAAKAAEIEKFEAEVNKRLEQLKKENDAKQDTQ